MANEEIASQVLDYWFAIEFLGQDSYMMYVLKNPNLFEH
mgnify:CR=1 FL=1